MIKGFVEQEATERTEKEFRASRSDSRSGVAVSVDQQRLSPGRIQATWRERETSTGSRASRRRWGGRRVAAGDSRSEGGDGKRGARVSDRGVGWVWRGVLWRACVFGYEEAAEKLSPAEKQELLLFLATRLRLDRARLPEPRKYTREQMAAWIAEDEAEMRRFQQGA
jgi:hypothetical protein